MTTRREFLKVSLLAGSALAIGFRFDDELYGRRARSNRMAGCASIPTAP